MSNLDYKKMVQDINEIVENDFVAEMESQTLPNSRPYTQDEALEMSKLLSKVYSISHGIHCVCGKKYIKDL